mmetsp:Transcript_15876/g.20998  ORF Transcript_15876/g.20998 Transcript_15876/m.20998 type:complete len:180 (+) Transcript_15876:92-631(+)
MESEDNIRLKQIEDCFNEFDSGQKGFLNVEDFKFAYLAMFGIRPSKFEVSQWVHQISIERNKKNGNSQEDSFDQIVYKQEFLTFMAQRLFYQDQMHHQRNLFNTLDIHSRGFITTEDLQLVVAQHCPSISPQVIENAFIDIDTNRVGRISFENFSKVMAKSHGDARPLSQQHLQRKYLI